MYYVLTVRKGALGAHYRAASRQGFKTRSAAILYSHQFGTGTIVVHESELPRYVSTSELIYTYQEPRRNHASHF